MPCNSDYLRPSDAEQRQKAAAELYVWACGKIGIQAPAWALEAAADVYGQSDSSPNADPTVNLCSLLTSLLPGALDSLVHGHLRSKMGRRMADWWEEHLDADRERLAEEAEDRRREELRASAKAKLTDEEWRALEGEL